VTRLQLAWPTAEPIAPLNPIPAVSLPAVGGLETTATSALAEALRTLAFQFGLQGGHYVHVGHAIMAVGNARAVTPVRFVATSVSDRRLYVEDGALAEDPPLRRLIDAHQPFVWSASAGERASAERHWLAGRLKGRGVHGGIAAPVQDYAAGPAYLSFYSAFSGEAEALIAERGPEIACAAAAFHEEAKAKLTTTVDSAGRNALTSREVECLRLAALGLTATESAETLDVSPRTVEFHLKNAIEKFGTTSKVRAVALAVSRGLVAP
jgi:LuxR family transcriptional activator of conjugal transfer of Ti plasmids